MPVSDQGLTHDRYQLVPRVLVFLTRQDQVLLIQGAPHKRIWANQYNGVGGHIERGEDVLNAARRELAEETGLVASGLRLCGTVTIDTGENPGIILFVLSGECLQGEPLPSSEGSPAWVPITRIEELPLVEDLPVLLPKVLNYQPGDPPFSAHYRYDSRGRLMITFGM